MPGERGIAKKAIKTHHLLLIAVAVLISDQLTKFLIQESLSLGSSIPVIKDIFHLTLVFNRGAAFGIFKNQYLFLLLIGIICVSFIILNLARLKKESTFVNVGTALILGGVIGNVVDRLRFGYVVDFLDFRIWPVFNVADSCITVGTILIVMQLLKRKT